MTLPVTRFEGLVYRAHHPGWAFDPESGEGARMYGGRFNRPSTACFYTSLRLETAWLEAQQGFAFKAQPMTLCSYRIDCSDILDLTTDEGLAAALVTRAELACAWEVLAADRKPVPTWELADRLIEAGCAGIIVPSFAARAGERDINLVLWRWTRDKPHVRRQNIWHRSRRKLAECGPRLLLGFRRRAYGVASADVQWSVA